MDRHHPNPWQSSSNTSFSNSNSQTYSTIPPSPIRPDSIDFLQRQLSNFSLSIPDSASVHPTLPRYSTLPTTSTINDHRATSEPVFFQTQFPFPSSPSPSRYTSYPNPNPNPSPYVSYPRLNPHPNPNHLNPYPNLNQHNPYPNLNQHNPASLGGSSGYGSGSLGGSSGYSSGSSLSSSRVPLPADSHSCLQYIRDREFELRRLRNIIRNNYINDNNNIMGINHNSYANTSSSSMRRTSYSSDRGNITSNGATLSSNSNHTRRLSWGEIEGNVVMLANDKTYSQYLIKQFVPKNPDCVTMIVSEIKDSVPNLLFNHIGSHFFQNLLEFVNPRDVVQLLKAITHDQDLFVNICLDNHGTRAAQAIVKYLEQENQEVQSIVVSAISGVVTTLMKDKNAYHFVIELVKKFQGVYEVTRPLLGEVLEDCVDMAMDKSGCCVLNPCIQLGLGPEREAIIRKIINRALDLSQDRYGNYVVQVVIESEKTTHLARVVRELKENFVSLSKHNFGSHVVEKCIVESDDDHAILIMKEISVTENVFLEICMHPMGNYVAKTAITRSKEMHGYIRPSMFQYFVDVALANYASLHSNMYGKKVLDHVNKSRFNVL